MCVWGGGRSGRFQSPEAGQVSTGIDTLWGRVRGGGAPQEQGVSSSALPQPIESA